MFDFLSNKLSAVFSSVTGQQYLTEKNMRDIIQKIEDALLESDVPLSVVQHFIQEIKQEVMGRKIAASLNASEQFINIVYKKLVTFLGGEKQQTFKPKNASVMLVMGLQGSGKTTTIAKLAAHFKQQNINNIMVGSTDFYRPAAREQLALLAQKISIDYYPAHAHDPVAAAQEIKTFGAQQQYQLIIIDTAGRLQIDEELMQELHMIEKTIKPQHRLLVLDAMTGQQSLQVAKAFDAAVGFEGTILTKIDSDTRAGAAFAFCYELKKPILFLGTGEKPDEFEVFRPERIASRMLGMGDIESLLERANQKIKKTEQEEAETAFQRGTFTLDDFAKQMNMMNRLGSFSQLMQFIPGMSGQQIPQDRLEQTEREMGTFKAIIASMTKKERLRPSLLNGSRKNRIAKGAGVAVTEVNNLLKRFEEMQQFAKLFKRMEKFPGF